MSCHTVKLLLILADNRFSNFYLKALYWLHAVHQNLFHTVKVSFCSYMPSSYKSVEFSVCIPQNMWWPVLYICGQPWCRPARFPKKDELRPLSSWILTLFHRNFWTFSGTANHSFWKKNWKLMWERGCNPSPQFQWPVVKWLSFIN